METKHMVSITIIIIVVLIAAYLLYSYLTGEQGSKIELKGIPTKDGINFAWTSIGATDYILVVENKEYPMGRSTQKTIPFSNSCKSKAFVKSASKNAKSNAIEFSGITPPKNIRIV